MTKRIWDANIYRFDKEKERERTHNIGEQDKYSVSTGDTQYRRTGLSSRSG